MAIAEEIPSNQRDKEDNMIEAPETANTDDTTHSHDVYELHALDMAQPEPQKPRSKLRLIAILIALDVSSSCIVFISLNVMPFDFWTNSVSSFSCRFSLLPLIKPSLLQQFLL
jgi:hypothetical protein